MKSLFGGMSLKLKLYIGLGIAAAVAIIALVIGLMFSGGNRRILSSETIRGVIVPASELVSNRYEYTDVAAYEDYKDFYGMRIPFTTDKQLLTYSGVIAIGCDLEKAKISVNNASKKISIHLPDIKILYHEVDEDSFKYYDISNSVFTEISGEGYSQFRKELKRKKEKALLKDKDFIKKTDQNTRKALEQLLTSSGDTKDYTVDFK